MEISSRIWSSGGRAKTRELLEDTDPLGNNHYKYDMKLVAADEIARERQDRRTGPWSIIHLFSTRKCNHAERPREGRPSGNTCPKTWDRGRCNKEAACFNTGHCYQNVEQKEGRDNAVGVGRPPAGKESLNEVVGTEALPRGPRASTRRAQWCGKALGCRVLVNHHRCFCGRVSQFSHRCAGANESFRPPVHTYDCV